MILREILAKFVVDVNAAPLVKANAAIGGAVGSLRTLGTALGAGAALYGLTHFINEMQEFGDELAKSSQKLGLSVSELIEWRHAAELSGASSESLATSFQILQKNAYEAMTGSKQMRQTFTKLGISLKDSNGQLKSGSILMDEVGAALGGMNNEAKKVALAKTLLGRGGAELIPMFNSGSKAIAEMRAEARELFGEYGNFIGDSETLNDEMTRFNLAMTGLKVMLARDVIPWVFKFVKGITNTVKSVRTFMDKASYLRTALIGLGVYFGMLAIQSAAAFMAPLITAALTIAAITAIALIVDDLITMFEGGESVIGDWIDSMFGVGAAQDVVAGLKAAWDLFMQSMVAVKDFALQVGEAISVAYNAYVEGYYAFANFLKEIIEGVVGVVFHLYETFQLLFDLPSKLIDVFKQAFTELTTWFDGLTGRILGLINDFTAGLDEIRDVASKVGSYLGIDLSGGPKAGAPRATTGAGAAIAGANMMYPSLAQKSAGTQVGDINQNYNFTVNSNASDPKQVADEVTKRLKESQDKQLANAYLHVTKVAGGSR